MFRLEISPDVLQELSKLDESIKRRIADKIDWLAAHGDKIIHHRLSNLPPHLRGLCKRREGDYPALFINYRSLLPSFPRKRESSGFRTSGFLPTQE
jgi:mRNA-degrading endonuclease RelE of RelBE toxin-antitoxin system